MTHEAHFTSWKSAGIEFLTDDNYTKKTAGKYCVVIIYAEWCGHCQRFAKDYEQFAQHIKNYNKAQGTNYLVGAVNGDNQGTKTTTAFLKIKGFPTIVFIQPSGESFRCDGIERTSQALSDAFLKFASK